VWRAWTTPPPSRPSATLRREANPLYWDTLEAFRRKAGCPAIVNASFNIPGEPTVCKLKVPLFNALPPAIDESLSDASPDTRKGPGAERGSLDGHMTVNPMVGTRPPKPVRSLAAWVIFVSFLVSLAAAEILLRLLAPLPDPYARFKLNSPPKPISREFPLNFLLETEVEPGLPGIPARRGRFTTSNVAFRGGFLARPKPAAEYRVFMVRGSTTECLYLDATEALAFVLQEELNQRLGGKGQWRPYGAGQTGHISYGKEHNSCQFLCGISLRRSRQSCLASFSGSSFASLYLRYSSRPRSGTIIRKRYTFQTNS